jgi:putative chitinase
MVSTINRNFLFERVNAELFGGKIKSGQKDGLAFILDVWEEAHAAKDDRWLAYALGTAFHEVDRTMKPIHEYGGNSYFFKKYDIAGDRPAKAKELGNLQPGDGILFHGRGFVQLTGRTNYEAMQKAFDVDLTSDAAAADRALEPELAAKIMFHGMEAGTFTGRKFSSFFNPTKEDWVNARRIINGLDKANNIAAYAKDFYGAISYTTA